MCCCRAKNYRLTHNGEDPPEYEEVENETSNGNFLQFAVFCYECKCSIHLFAEAVVPNEVDAYVAEGGSALGWKQGRQLLKQYLQVTSFLHALAGHVFTLYVLLISIVKQSINLVFKEIGYSEQILDVRSFRVKNLLGLIPQVGFRCLFLFPCWHFRRQMACICRV